MDFTVYTTILKQYGPMAALLVYVLYTNHNREQRYITIIETLTEDIKERLGKMEAFMRGRGHL